MAIAIAVRFAVNTAETSRGSQEIEITNSIGYLSRVSAVPAIISAKTRAKNHRITSRALAHDSLVQPKPTRNQWELEIPNFLKFTKTFKANS